ncbi:hypothetical protein PSTG_09097 [Puccinia striiformis f. sp. tritici PST-78]|uniref:Uncharacterized protein n=1 Tax=Puccinia striiformis f. sp. tritici PST-78 TaxID=1165861 RepID=A0A0L0VEJ9_9BASI|nr:hypothetical protein PSTG_09097 [Puccinia striiformis f. sp. tritici PST-78]
MKALKASNARGKRCLLQAMILADPSQEIGFRGKPLCETETLRGCPPGSHQEACVRLAAFKVCKIKTSAHVLKAKAASKPKTLTATGRRRSCRFA